MKPNPELYERLSQPKASKAEAQAAAASFLDAVQSLRVGCDIADVALVVSVPYREGDALQEMRSVLTLGNQLQSVRLFSIGVQTAHQAMVEMFTERLG